MVRKNKTLSLESIKKQKTTKQKKLLTKYNWIIIEPYLDNKIENGLSGERTKEYLTLREFKDLILSGQSINDLMKKEYSKHLLSFYSNFSQGKIKLTKEEFVKAYDSGKDLGQISRENNIPRNNISYLRQLYNINRIGPRYQEAKRKEIELTQKQKELIYGSLMGDAKKMSHWSIGFVQCEEQKTYLLWKFHEMHPLSLNLKEYRYLDNRSGNESVSWRFYTQSGSDQKVIIDQFYQSGTKQITQNILDQLTPLSIAVWYMDDGKVDWQYRALKDKYKNNYMPEVFLCTDSFSEESCLLIQKWFKEKHNIQTTLRNKHLKDRMGYRILIKDAQKFFDLIRPYILPYFQYKIDYEAYLKRREHIELGIVK